MAIGSKRSVVTLSTNWASLGDDGYVCGLDYAGEGYFSDSSVSGFYVGDYISFSNDSTGNKYKVTEVSEGDYGGEYVIFDGQYTPVLGDVVTIYNNTSILFNAKGRLHPTPDVLTVYIMENSIKDVEFTIGYVEANTDIHSQSDVYFKIYGRTSKDGAEWTSLGEIAVLSDVLSGYAYRQYDITTLQDWADLSSVIPEGSKYLQIRSMICVGDAFTQGYSGEYLYNGDGVSEVSEWSGNVELPIDTSNVRIFADILNEGNCTWLSGELVVFHKTDETTGSWIAGIGKINQ